MHHCNLLACKFVAFSRSCNLIHTNKKHNNTYPSLNISVSPNRENNRWNPSSCHPALLLLSRVRTAAPAPFHKSHPLCLQAFPTSILLTLISYRDSADRRLEPRKALFMLTHSHEESSIQSMAFSSRTQLCTHARRYRCVHNAGEVSLKAGGHWLKSLCCWRASSWMSWLSSLLCIPSVGRPANQRRLLPHQTSITRSFGYKIPQNPW